MIYAIYDYASMDPSKWLDVIENETSVRRDTDTGDACIIKWLGANPSWIDSEVITTYTKTDLKTEMSTQGIWEE